MKKILTAIAIVLPAFAGAATADTLENRVAALEAQVQQLEDVASIERLTRDYGYAIDKQPGKDYDEALLRTLFTEDATWAAPAFQVNLSGLDQIAPFIGQGLGRYQTALHLFATPRIDISGDTAVGTWQLWWGTAGAEGGTAIALQTETLEYVRTANGWRIKSIFLNTAAQVAGK